MEIIQFLLNNSSTFIFVLTRTGSIIMAAPIFGTFNIPMQVKIGLSFLIALIITPLTAYVPLPQTFTALVMGIGGEMLIGIAIGLSIRFIFTGIEFAGQIASFQMGIGMASVYDPMSNSQMAVLGKMISLLTLLTFLSVNGHLMLIMALKKSFEVIPPYGFRLTDAFMENFIIFSREIFILAVKFSAPVVAILVFINVALGIMARTVPQLNMFVVGFAITILVGFVMISLSMPAFETALIEVFDRMWQGVFNLIGEMHHA